MDNTTSLLLTMQSSGLLSPKTSCKGIWEMQSCCVLRKRKMELDLVNPLHCLCLSNIEVSPVMQAVCSLEEWSKLFSVRLFLSQKALMDFCNGLFWTHRRNDSSLFLLVQEPDQSLRIFFLSLEHTELKEVILELQGAFPSPRFKTLSQKTSKHRAWTLPSSKLLQAKSLWD